MLVLCGKMWENVNKMRKLDIFYAIHGGGRVFICTFGECNGMNSHSIIIKYVLSQLYGGKL